MEGEGGGSSLDDDGRITTIVDGASSTSPSYPPFTHNNGVSGSAVCDNHGCFQWIIPSCRGNCWQVGTLKNAGG